MCMCSDPNCDIPSNVCDIDEFYGCIVNALSVASDCLVTGSHGNYSHVTGWNDHVKRLAQCRKRRIFTVVRQ
jgi:hypothetical protein